MGKREEQSVATETRKEKVSGRKTKSERKYGKKNEDASPNEEELRHFQNLGKAAGSEQSIEDPVLTADKEINESNSASQQTKPETVDDKAAENVDISPDKASDVKPQEARPAEEAKPAVEAETAEPRATLKITRPAEKDANEKNILTQKEFEQKYPNILKKNHFRSSDEKGGWVYIAKYDEKTGEIFCYFGVDGKNKISSKKIGIAELDAILKEYAYEKSGPKPEPEAQAGAGSEVEDSEIEKEKKEELADFKEFGIKYYNKVKNEADWSGYKDKQKKIMLQIMTEVFIKKFIREQSEFFKNKAEEIAEKVSVEIT
jgi:hypothetical protein